MANFKLFFLLAILICLSVVIAQVNDVVNADGTVPDDNVERISYLLEATSQGDLDGIRAALDNGEDINSENVNGWTAASFAVAAGDLELLRFLVESEIDLNIANNEGYTPLMLAALQVNKNLQSFIFNSNHLYFVYRAIKNWLSSC